MPSANNFTHFLGVVALTVKHLIFQVVDRSCAPLTTTIASHGDDGYSRSSARGYGGAGTRWLGASCVPPSGPVELRVVPA